MHDVKDELRELKNRVIVLELYMPFSEKDENEKSDQLEFENLMGEFREEMKHVEEEILERE